MDKILSLEVNKTGCQATIFDAESEQILAKKVTFLQQDVDFDQEFINQYCQLADPEQEERQSLFQLQAIRELFEDHREDLVASILVLPPANYLSMNISAPFADSADARSILAGELRDELPFDLEKFDVSYYFATQAKDVEQDVYVAMLPNDYLQFFLKEFSDIGLEFNFVTTPAAVLRGAVLEPDSAENFITIKQSDDFLYVTAYVDGSYRSSQFLTKQGARSYVTQINMLIIELENRYSCKIDFLLMVNSESSSDSFSQADFSIPLKFLAKDLSISQLAFKTVQDVQSQPVANFSKKQNDVFELIKNIGQVIFLVWKWVLIVAILGAVVPVAYYYFRESKIDRLDQEVSSLITRKLPEARFTKGQELNNLMSESASIELQLDSLGAGNQYDPFDLYMNVSRVLTNAAEDLKLDLSDVYIRSNSIFIKGTVPDYSGVDRLKSLLEQEKNIFCSVKSDQIAGGGSVRRFSFEITPC